MISNGYASSLSSKYEGISQNKQTNKQVKGKKRKESFWGVHLDNIGTMMPERR